MARCVCNGEGQAGPDPGGDLRKEESATALVWGGQCRTPEGFEKRGKYHGTHAGENRAEPKKGFEKRGKCHGVHVGVNQAGYQRDSGKEEPDMKRKKLLLCVICVALAAAAFLGWKLWRRQKGDQGVLLEAGEDRSPGTVISYCQRDEVWKDDKLGDSAYTMGRSGCLTSCIASALSTERENLGVGSTITPGELNRLFGENQVYNGSGDIVWGKIRDALPDAEVLVASSIDETEMEGLLAQGHYPAVKVKTGGNGAAHWVLLVGSQGGEYLCMDPLREDGQLIPLSTHGGVVYRMRCVYWKE